MADDYEGILAELSDDILEFERRTVEDVADSWYITRKEALKKLHLTEAETDKILAVERQKLDKQNNKITYQDRLAQAKSIAENALSEEDRLSAKKEVRSLNLQKKLNELALSGINQTFDKITQAADYYSGLVEKVQTRLIGSSKDFESISKVMTKTFAVSPFFAMKDAMAQVSSFIEKGIAFNVEMRASMAVLSDKVARTFDAFDSNLLRLVRIQQQDSTMARLGMENVLTKFLNTNFQDTSYLDSLSDTVSANILEATSRMSTDTAVSFDLSLQKWLGSLYSVGVSDSLITKLSQAVGYLASGDVDSLNSQEDLQTLLISAANRGGADYGSLLLGLPTSQDIDKIFTGFVSLINEISETGSSSAVSLNQYAKIFGLSVSDLKSTVNNITQENINAILSLNTNYDALVQTVKDESSFSKLFSRTGGADISKNLLDNLYLSVGKNIGSSAGSYLAWQLTDFMTDFLKGLETGMEIAPFGVGTSFEFNLSDIIKATAVTGAMASGIAGIAGSLSSLGGINLNALENSQKETKGSAFALSQAGKTTSSMTSSVMDFSESTMYQQAKSATDSAATQVTDKDINKEEEEMKKTQNSLRQIGDNVSFIVQMLNRTGIVIRGRTGTVMEDTIFDEISQGFVSR